MIKIAMKVGKWIAFCVILFGAGYIANPLGDLLLERRPRPMPSNVDINNFSFEYYWNKDGNRIVFLTDVAEKELKRILVGGHVDAVSGFLHGLPTGARTGSHADRTVVAYHFDNFGKVTGFEMYQKRRRWDSGAQVWKMKLSYNERDELVDLSLSTSVSVM